MRKHANKTVFSELLIAAFTGGFSALFLQTLLFRFFFNTFSGSAWAISFFFAGWLLWTGLGSILARTLPLQRIHLTGTLASMLLFLPAFFAQYFLLIHARTWMHLPDYEAVPAFNQLMLPLLLNAPIPMVSGFLFVSLTSCYCAHNTETRLSATPLYIAEATGSLCAGLLLTGLFHGGFPLLKLAFFDLTIHSLLMALSITRLTRNIKGCVSWIPPILIVISLLFGMDQRIERSVNQYNWARHIPDGSCQQAFSTPNALYLSGKYRENALVISWDHLCERIPTPESNLLLTSLILSQSPHPENILIIGQGTYSLCIHLVGLPFLPNVTWITTDPNYPAMLQRAFPNITSHATDQLHIPEQPPRQFLQSSTNAYDVILLDLPAGNTLGNSAYLTTSFFQKLKNSLSPRGVLLVSTIGTENYISEERGFYGATIYHTLRSVFHHVTITPEEQAWLIASDATPLCDNASTIFHQLQELNISSSMAIPEAAWMLYDQPRSRSILSHYQALIKRYGSILVNRLDNPVPPFFSMLLMIRQSRPDLPSLIPTILSLRAILPGLIILALLSYCVLRIQRLFIRHTHTSPAKSFDLKILLTVTGFCGFSLHLLLMFLYQSFFDTLYSTAGLLSALFMAGIILGGCCAVSLLKRHHPASLFSIPSTLFPLLCTVIYFIPHYPLSIVFLGLFLCAGFTTGFIVPPIETLAAHTHTGKQSAMWIVWFDAIGSTLGALLSGLFIIPILGSPRTLILLAIMAPAIILPTVIAHHRETIMKKEHIRFIIMVILLPLAGICGLLAFNQKNSAYLTRQEYHQYHSTTSNAETPAQSPPHRVGLTSRADPAERPRETPAQGPSHRDGPTSKTASDWLSKTAETETGMLFPYEQRTTTDGTILYRFKTRPLSGDIHGYAGPVPMQITIDSNRRLHQLTFLPNRETPAYFEPVKHWAQQFIGLPISDSTEQSSIDTLTGATYSSDAVQRSLIQACARFFALLSSNQTPPQNNPPEMTIPYTDLPGKPRKVNLKRMHKMIKDNELSDHPAYFSEPQQP